MSTVEFGLYIDPDTQCKYVMIEDDGYGIEQFELHRDGTLPMTDAAWLALMDGLVYVGPLAEGHS